MLKKSILFTPEKIAGLKLPNRFVRSATYENAADLDGRPAEDYLKIYRNLSRGNIGLIITGMIYTMNEGKSYRNQAGLHDDSTIDDFSVVTGMVHETGSKIFAQLCHGGRQTRVKGLRPSAASISKPDIFFKTVPGTMSGREINEVIRSFKNSAARARKAGFDGIQLHAAHGYRLSGFLSPYFNRRNDEWGGDSTRRFNLLKRVYESVREAVGKDFPVTVKINAEDYTPGPGLTIDESSLHICRLAEIGIDSVELSCGTLCFSMFNQSRGGVPVQAFSKTMPPPLRPMSRLILKSLFPEKKFTFYENYNREFCANVKPLIAGTPLMLVGGLRNFYSMEEIVNSGDADFVSMCRPFIRQPALLNKWVRGEFTDPSCVNCNNCLGAIALHEKLACSMNRKF
jgi:2,4-dienoyl-CoA reductase-like NADH-dependent reductase (Old Yellow Enzyme family)